MTSGKILLTLALLLLIGPLPAGAQRPAVSAPRQHGAPPAARDPYTPRIPPRALAYQRSGYALTVVGLAWNLLGLWLVLRTGLSARLRDGAYRRLRRPAPGAGAAPPLAAVALYLLAFSLLLFVWSLPPGLMRLARQHHFGFSRQTLPGFLGDALLDTAFSLVLIPVVWGGYVLFARAPRRWWLALWALSVPLLFILIVLHPVVIAPAYNRYEPLAPGPLREQILTLAARAGITGGRVLVEDTSRRTRHVNAYVTGLGPSTRIVLNDTALQTLPPDQLLAMMGHEMGHYVEGHIWVGFATGALGAGVFFWLLSRLLPWAAQRGGGRWRLHGTGDLATLPLVLLLASLFLLAQAPIASGISRALERRADAFGLRVTGRNEATARLMVGFAERDFSDPDPPFLFHLWFGSHPTLRERIAFALRHEPRT